MIGEIESILTYARIPPVVNQVEAHPYFQQQELFDYLKSKSIALVAYSPLGNIDPVKFAPAFTDPLLVDLGKKLNKTPAQITVSYALQRGLIVIPKTVTVDRLKENFHTFELSPDDFQAVASLDKKEGRQVVPSFAPSGFWERA